MLQCYACVVLGSTGLGVPSAGSRVAPPTPHSHVPTVQHQTALPNTESRALAPDLQPGTCKYQR